MGDFPNRTWPWREEDDGCPEAETERIRRCKALADDPAATNAALRAEVEGLRAEIARLKKERDRWRNKAIVRRLRKFTERDGSVGL